MMPGVTPGKGGEVVEGVPVFGSIDEAVARTGAEASVFFVPPPFVKDTAIQTIKAGIKLIAVVSEHVPVHDVVEVREKEVVDAIERSQRIETQFKGVKVPYEIFCGLRPPGTTAGRPGGAAPATSGMTENEDTTEPGGNEE